MYTPASFSEHDLTKLHDFIEAHPFAVIVSASGESLEASHLPFILDRSPTNGRLVGHFAKANPQWSELDGREVLVIFNGPHAYISPAWYEAKNTVPTWNYVAVHVYGTVRVEHDHDNLMELLRRATKAFEESQPSPWSLDSVDSGFARKLLDGIVGIEVEINRIEGKWKLNQNHDVERQSKVATALRKRGTPESIAVAELMEVRVEHGG